MLSSSFNGLLIMIPGLGGSSRPDLGGNNGHVGGNGMWTDQRYSIFVFRSDNVPCIYGTFALYLGYFKVDGDISRALHYYYLLLLLVIQYIAVH